MDKPGEEFIRGLINDYSTANYNPHEFTNHIPYGIFALNRLGADQDRISKFTKSFEIHLERPHQSEKELPTTVEVFTLGELKGKYTSFYPIFEYFEKLFRIDCNTSMEIFLSKAFPILVQGLAAHAFHGLIQLGYGLAIGSQRMALEGCAYIVRCYLPIVEKTPDKNTWGKGKRSILNVLYELGHDDDLFCYLEQERVKRNLSSNTDIVFNPHMAILLGDKGDHLMTYVDSLQLPSCFSDKENGDFNRRRIADWLVDAALTVYVASSKRNDFFLLHGVTSAWALKQVLILLDDSTMVLKAARIFLCALFATYLVRDRPFLDLNQLQPRSVMPNWPEIFSKALNEHEEDNTHMYKLIQVAHDMSLEYAENNDLYLLASLAALDQ